MSCSVRCRHLVRTPAAIDATGLAAARAGLVALAISGLVVAACSPANDPAGTDGAVAADSRPNVVLIVADDAGYADFGAFGDPEMPTPRIDSIADNGIRFTQGYNVASVCSPSRAGLLTGRYPQRFGHEFNIPRTPQPGADIDDIGLPLSESTMADAMRSLGYATIAVGKWHLGVSDRFHPLERGFDEFYGFLYGSRSYFPLDDISERGMYLLRDNEPQPERGYLTDVLAEETANLIERYRDQPFFMYVNFNAVHTPMHAKPEHEALFEDIENERRRTLAAMTVSLDEGVGTILDKLAEVGLLDNTIVFFLNDNGGATNNASTNHPLRGQKGDKFEGGIRVPFMVQWPERLPRGADFDYPVSSMDVFPTIVAAAGGVPAGSAAELGSPGTALSAAAELRSPGAAASADDRPAPQQPLDGVNLLPYLTGKANGPPHRTLFWRRGAIAAVRYVDENSDLKLIRVDNVSTWLFDLAADPYETVNLLDSGALGRDQLPQRVYLESALEAWEEGTVEPLWRTDPYWTQNQIDKHTPGTAQPPTATLQEGYTPTAANAPSTDIYVGTLSSGDGTPTNGEVSVADVTNITDRDGYDNQPAFEPGGQTLLYTSARNRTQTDIYRHDIRAGTTRQVTQTLSSEFSATPLPSGDGFSSIHESATAQQLWRFDNDGTSRGGILDGIQPVGYHAWADENMVVMFVLGGDGTPATLQLGDLRTGEAEVLAENPGRSLHKIPGRRAISFVRKIDQDNWWIEVYDLDTGEFTRLLPTLPGREDYAWMPDGSIIMGDGSKLFLARPADGALVFSSPDGRMLTNAWTEIADLTDAGVIGITRLAINDTGTRIAIVGNRQDN